MGWHRIPYQEKGYARYAAIQNIEVRLADARANLRKADREVRWMEVLLAQRAGQNAAGEWPALANDESPAGEQYWARQWDKLEELFKTALRSR